jgi:hypothetical protein
VAAEAEPLIVPPPTADEPAELERQKAEGAAMFPRADDWDLDERDQVWIAEGLALYRSWLRGASTLTLADVIPSDEMLAAMSPEEERAWAGIEPEMSDEEEAAWAGLPPPSASTVDHVPPVPRVQGRARERRPRKQRARASNSGSRDPPPESDSDPPHDRRARRPARVRAEPVAARGRR